MKIKRPKKSGFLETCAASDLAFLLIIYFLVIAGFSINKGLVVELPSRHDDPINKESDAILRLRMYLKDDPDNIAETGENEVEIIYTGESNHIFNSDHTYSIITIREPIETMLNENPDIDIIVVLEIDSQAPWQSYVSFVEYAKVLGFDINPSMITREHTMREQ